MKKRYRIWHLPVLSFFSKPLYRDVAARWKGTNLGYFCLLLAICLVPAALNLSQHTIEAIDRYRDIYLMQVPSIQLSNGILSIDAPQPYSIIEGNRTVLLIDTTGEIQTLEEADALSLMTRTRLYVLQEGGRPLVYDLKDFNDFTLNQEVLGEIISRIQRVLMLFSYVLIYLGCLVFFIIAALLLGGIACLIAGLQKKSLRYKAGVRIAVVALTPAMITGAILASFGRTVPALLYVLLTLAYLYIAAGSARRIRPNELYLEDERIGS